METSEEYTEVLNKIQSREMDPLSATELLVNNICIFKDNT